LKKVCVYCGSSPGFDTAYMKMAESLGKALVRHDLELVFGGADIGLMGQVSSTVMREGGAVYGVIPGLIAEKVPHGGLTEMIVETTMHKRKEKMFDLADAFVALPGGFGTLEELSEVLTWTQLGLNTKP